MRLTKNVVIACSIILAGCTASGDYQGREYAPNMYHSVAYEPLSQITDKDAGRWATSIDYPDGHAEYYNTSKYNGGPNVRVPPANTVRRNSYGGWLPYRLPADSVGLRLAKRLVNPFDSTAAIQGKVLYEMYCDHCHGPKGKGDGKVASGVKIDGVEKSAYNGVANLTSDALKNVSEGHIFHVITYGKGLMWAHGSQVSPEDRWRIAKYVKTLQK